MVSHDSGGDPLPTQFTTRYFLLDFLCSSKGFYSLKSLVVSADLEEPFSSTEGVDFPVEGRSRDLAVTHSLSHKRRLQR